MGKSSNQTAAYRFKLRNHAGLTYGPMDAYLEFRGGDKTAWSGRQTVSGAITVDAPKLWGGDKDQGGIVGALYVMMGEDDQVPNAMLVDAFGDQTGAWRGFATVAFDGVYGANNPYPQPQSHKIEKILKGWDDDAPWYPAAAAIVSAGPDAPALIERFVEGDLSKYSVVEGINSGFTIDTVAGETVLATGQATPSGHNVIGRPLATPAPLYRMRVRFMVTDVGADDAGVFTVRDAGGDVVVSFISCRQASIDSLRRPAVQFRDASGSPGELIGAGGVDTDTWFLFDATYDPIAEQFACTVVRELDGLLHGSLEVAVASPADVATLGWTVDDFVGAGRTVWTDAQIIVGTRTGYINPAHALYYLRTQSHKGGEPTANIDNASFTAGADQLYAEGFGICVRHDPDQESIEDVENRICKLIGGSVNRSPIDGKLHLDLARGNYVLDDLPVVTDDDILDFSELPTTPEGAVNSVSVRYFDPQRKETIITPSVDALGLIDEFGLNHQVIDYPEIPTAALAARIATRELLQFITPSRAFDLPCKPSVYALQPNQYFRLQTPKRGIDDMVCIMGDKQGGTLKSGAIRLQAAQVADTLPAFGSVDVETGVDTTPPTIPTAIADQVAFEAPYINVCTAFSPADLAVLQPEAGFLVAAAEDPDSSRDFTLVVDAGAGYLEQGDGDWCPTLVVNEAAPLEDPLPVNFTFSGGKHLDAVAVGDVALWGSELCRLDGIDIDAGTLTLGRACADTVPQEHTAGEKLWFYSEGSARDTTEYSDGETVSAKLLTNTFSQQLPISDATPIDVTFDMRQARPYAPGLVRIDGTAWPATVTGTFDVTWAHRDRVLQANQLLDTEAASVGPEVTVRYALQLFNDSTDALLVEKLDIDGDTATVNLAASADVRLVLYAISDNGESWQKHEHVFAYTTSTPLDTITADTWTASETVHDGGGDPL